MTKRRWLASAITRSADATPALPWMRGNRRRPAALAVPATPARKTAAQAAK